MPLQPRRLPLKRKSLGIPLVLLATGVLAAAIAFAARPRGAPPPPPRPTTPPPPRPNPTISFHLRNLGHQLKITVLVLPDAPYRPEELFLIDAAGHRYPSSPDDPRDCFLRETQTAPAARALSFRAPAEAVALDLHLPGLRTIPVYREPGPEADHPPDFPIRYEDWTIQARGSFPSDSDFDLEIEARPAADRPVPLDPRGFLLLTGDGRVLAPQVRKESDPIRLRYSGLLQPPRPVRIQTHFRSERPEYLVFKPPADRPERAGPPSDGPTPPLAAPAGLRDTFETRFQSDPLEALRSLGASPSEESRRLAREALARQIPQDVSTALKAFLEGRVDLAEKPLTRAALLAEPYAPDLSTQLMRMLLQMGSPRRTPIDCTTCGGAGTGPCPACRRGSTEGPCPRCETTGRIPCLLCEGAGTMDHCGFRGTLALTIPRDLRIRHQGRMGTLKAQTLTYRMEPCEGGQFHLRTESVLTADGLRKTDSLRQPCTRFWEEMKLFVFTGKARVVVQTPQNRPLPLSPTAAKRFLADYEHCRDGRIPCDRCAGGKSESCSLCSGKGRAVLLCAPCEGTGLKICPVCRGHGPSAWLAEILPPAAAPELCRTLSGNATLLRQWLDERCRNNSRRNDLARRLDEAKKGLDPTAKLTPHTVEVTCPRCKGQGGDCEECWATGRREYYDGTPQYERYALVERLQRRLKESTAGPLEPPELAPLSPLELATTSRPTAPPPPFSPPARKPGAPLPTPPAVEELIRKADVLLETGRAHLEKAKASSAPAAGAEEAMRAVAALLQARTLYATAQENLDDLGIEPPRELLQKFRITLQALVMARRAAP